MTKSTNGEPATAQPVEQKGPQAGSDDQPLHPNSNTSRDRIMARVAESKARIDAMSPEERRALLDLGDAGEGVGPEEAMRILEELEGGWDNDSEEDDEAAESGGAEGWKPKVTDDEQGKDKPAPEAGGAQDEKEKIAKEKQESEDVPAPKS